MSVTALSLSSMSIFANEMTTTASADVITWWYNNGITKYDSWSSFNADAYVTREQAAKMIVTWIGSHHELWLSMTAENADGCTFKDAASIDETLVYGADSMCAYGLMKWFQGNFMPKNLISYKDLNTMFVRAIDMMPAYSDYQAALSAYANTNGFLTRGQLLNGLHYIDAIVTKQIADDKDIALTEAQAKLDAAKALWNSKNVDDYTARQQLSCFCAPGSTHPISFDVKNGVVVSGSMHDVNETDQIPASELYATPKTVVEMFALVQDAIDRKADSMTIEYDATYGYPKTVNIDYSTMMADEEQYYTYALSNIGQ